MKNGNGMGWEKWATQTHGKFSTYPHVGLFVRIIAQKKRNKELILCVVYSTSFIAKNCILHGIVWPILHAHVKRLNKDEDYRVKKRTLINYK